MIHSVYILIYIYTYIYIYGSVRLASYFDLLTKPAFYTVVQQIDIIYYLRVLASGGPVWPGFFQFWAALGSGLLVQDPLRCTCGIEADAIQSPGYGGWAGVTIEVDYWWAMPGGWALNNIVFELAVETTPLGACF